MKLQIDQVDAPGLTETIGATLRSWKIENFTQVQTLALAAGIANGCSQIVCAPTSSGKTLIGEIAILSALDRGCRCIYLVSHKALADQKYLDFENRFGDTASTPRASIGLSTGDREEGDISPQLLIATYEKSLSLLLSGQLDLGASVIIADELQILADPGRGSSIEALCAIFRRQSVDQFVGLTATIGNGQELADWLKCKLVTCSSRDVELHQEIWYSNTGYRVLFGQETGESCHDDEDLPTEIINAVDKLIEMDRAPVLVFTESRGEASELAARYSQRRVRTAEGIALAQHLELFSEPTESSQQLQNNAQKRITFHTADLTSQEREVIEQGFIDDSFDVCFATSTLAAGVNFPFKTVLFSKITYQYGERDRTMITRSDYRNMSGRAGRLGLHPQGFAILLPKNPRELGHANDLVLPENDNISSQLVRLSMRRTILSLVAFGVVNGRSDLEEFFQHTFYWHQIREKNPNQLAEIVSKAKTSVDWLISEKMIDEDFGCLMPTPYGKAVAQSGLLPSTASKLIEALTAFGEKIDESFDKYIVGIIHWVSNCPEFKGDKPSRFLPYPARGQAVNANGYLSTHPLLGPLDRTDNRANQCVHALHLFCNGTADRFIRNQTNIPSGQLHRLASDVAWVIDGLRKIATVPELEYPQTLTNNFAMLARQVQWGAPAEALDILRVAQKEGVPGFGRQRALALVQRGIQTFDQLLGSAKDILSQALGNERRVSALLEAVSACIGFKGDRLGRVHQELAEKLGLAELVRRCAELNGEDYEAAIAQLMQTQSGWTVEVIDDGIQQNVPDLLIRSGSRAFLVECKTTTKRPPFIKKEEAFAVMQKAIDFDKSMHRVTLGKPSFDEHSKKKVLSASDLTIVEHDIFIEASLRLCSGTISIAEFLNWLSKPGLAEIDRLGGRPTYEVLKELQISS